jgi:hypothetical protein
MLAISIMKILKSQFAISVCLVPLALAGCDRSDAGLPEADVSTLKDPKVVLNSENLPLTSSVDVDKNSSDQQILSSHLVNGWNNWTWAPNKLVGGELRVTVTKPWDGVYFAHAAQPSSQFASLEFKFKNGPKDINFIQARARVNGRPLAPYGLPGILANKTKIYKVSLAQLGLNDESFDGFFLQTKEMTTYTIEDVLLKGNNSAPGNR